MGVLLKGSPLRRHLEGQGNPHRGQKWVLKGVRDPPCAGEGPALGVTPRTSLPRPGPGPHHPTACTQLPRQVWA